MSKPDNRHKRATRNPDHRRRTHVPAPADGEVAQRLHDLVQPAVYAELAYYRALGLRQRVLSLPVMVAVVLALLWRRVPGVCALQRLLAEERVLWAEPQRVSQPALSERFLQFPAVLFERVLYRVLARLPERLAQRTRPLPPRLGALAQRFAHLYALDGTTLEALFRKLRALRQQPDAPLAGHLGVVVDLLSHLPARVWFAQDPKTNDKALLPYLLDWLPANSLLVFDLGYFAFTLFDALSAAGCWFVTRLRAKTGYVVEQVLLEHADVRERIVRVGLYRSHPCATRLRLIEVCRGGTWYAYVTNVLDPQQLSLVEVLALYEARWHIETAFLLVKRLLDLSYLWVGSLNGVQLQVWATWLYYAILVDLCDDVAEVLQLPLARISVEMVARSLYFYAQACQRGYTGSAVAYLTDPQRSYLGIVKRLRPRPKPPLADYAEALLRGLHPPARQAPNL